MDVTPETIDRAVEFDSPFRIEEDGTLTRPLPDVFAPEVWHVEGERHPNDVEIPDGWTAWSVGYTGQYSYNGAVMHSSEYIGGRMARDLLEDPGTYVVCSVEVHPEDAYEGEGDDPAPAGWIVLKAKS